MANKFKLQKIGKLILLAAVLFSISSNARATGVLDTSFGNGGRVIAGFGSSSPAEIQTILILPDGKIVATSGNRIVRYNSNGSLDAAFGNGGIVVLSETDIQAVAMQPDGKIVVAGRIAVNAEASIYDFLIARFNPNGSPDSGFGTNGVVTVNQEQEDCFYAVLIRPDGKIIAAGDYGNFRPAVIGFNANGSLDATFGDGGLVYPSFPDVPIFGFRDIGQQPSGNIVVGGAASPGMFGAVSRKVVVALDGQGGLVQNFGSGGLAIANGSIERDEYTELTVQADGKIILAGRVITRFLPDGTIDPTFIRGGAADDIALLPDGKFITTQSGYRTIQSNEKLYLHAAGNRRIGKAELRITLVNDVAVQSDGKIVAAGIHFANGQFNFVLVRYSTITSAATRLAEFGLDEKTDIAVYRPENRAFYILDSQFNDLRSATADTAVSRIIPEDYNGSFRSQLGYWSAPPTAGAPSSFYVIPTPGGFGTTTGFQWGASGDIPVGGDYDGDNRTDYTVFRPLEGVWYILQSSNNQPLAVRWGLAEDKPVPADYDYDGITDIAVYRPSQGVWYVRRSSDAALIAVRWGSAADIPLAGDFDGDGRADFVVFRPSNGTWYLLNTTEGFRAEKFGLENDSPVPGDYDGDGRHDVAVFRQGSWYILGSTRGFYGVQWGAPTDVPVAVRYAY